MITKKHTAIFLFLLAIVLTFLMVRYRWIGKDGNEWKSIIDGDGKDYYAYLDEIFISHNFGAVQHDFGQVFLVNDRTVIKCYCGTSLAITPFFLSAQLIASVYHLPNDTYSEVFQKAISFAALFYLLLGCYFIISLFRHLQIKKFPTIITIILILFATNLLVYSIFHPAMSHVYSFCFISGFLWAMQRYIATNKLRFLSLSAIFFGIIYLIRPVNIIIICFLPFFFSNLSEVLLFLKTQLRRLWIPMLLFLMIISLQNILWFVQCRRPFLEIYPHEGFYWLHPELFNVLFSFRKGLFVYTPLTLLCVLGLIPLFRENKFKALISTLFLMLLLYVISSWWCWSYFDGFGMRPYVDFFAVFALLLVLLLQKSNQWKRTVLLIIAIGLIPLNLVQAYQYSQGIIHPDYMNFENYKYVFLKTSDEYKGCVGGQNDLVPYDKFYKKLIYQSDVYPKIDGSDSTNILILKGETQKAYIYDSLNEFNFYLKLTEDTSLLNSNQLFAEIHLQKRDLMPCDFHNNLMVISLTCNDTSHVFYETFPLNYLPNQSSTQWQHLNYKTILPAIPDKYFKLEFYIWNKKRDSFLIKDLQIKIYRTS